jgi:hypothetical protein
VNFDAQSFGLSGPANYTVYYRPTTAEGLFLPQPTAYNPVTGKISVAVTLTSQENDLGEFILCSPELPDVPYPPLLNEVENYRGIQPYDVIAPKAAVPGVTASLNQEIPVLLSWSPKGFARSYQLQISADPDFATTLFSMLYQNDAYSVWNEAAPGKTYFYRVKTVNEGGESDWSTGSFQTTPPYLTLTFPNNGEALQRGLSYFLRWKDNLAENVSIELYKGGTLAKIISTNAPSSGAYQWPVGFDLAAGSDYSIKVTSLTNLTLSAQSSAFSIVDTPEITPGSVTRSVDGRVQFGITAPGAAQVSVLGSTNLSDWQLLQSVPVSGGSAVFTDSSAPNLPSLFYRLRVP